MSNCRWGARPDRLPLCLGNAATQSRRTLVPTIMTSAPTCSTISVGGHADQLVTSRRQSYRWNVRLFEPQPRAHGQRSSDTVRANRGVLIQFWQKDGALQSCEGLEVVYNE